MRGAIKNEMERGRREERGGEGEVQVIKWLHWDACSYHLGNQQHKVLWVQCFPSHVCKILHVTKILWLSCDPVQSCNMLTKPVV